ncbi:hypothetical protein ACOBQX_28555 [Actinokineospora sp. G85]|uniref:hypothetical protein n=1 Tax=Actinokineospora sp. G85 TaxID=3406626 RepID=UPI003C7093A2
MKCHSAMEAEHVSAARSARAIQHGVARFAGERTAHLPDVRFTTARRQLEFAATTDVAGYANPSERFNQRSSAAAGLSGKSDGIAPGACSP